LVLTLIISGTGLGLVRWQPPVLWADQFGTRGVNIDNSINTISVGTSGVYAGGYVGYPLTGYVNASPSYLFVARYTPNGYQDWIRRLGSVNLSWISSVSAATDGVYVGGYINGTGVIRKYDLAGSGLWSQQFGNEDGPGVSVGTDAVYAAGRYEIIGNGVRSVILQAYKLSGGPIWTNLLGNSTTISGLSLKIYANSEDVFVAGSDAYGSYGFVRMLYANGTIGWNRQLLLTPPIFCSCFVTGLSGDSSGIYVAGTLDPFGPQNDMFLRKYDFKGNELWRIQSSSPDYSGDYDVQLSTGSSGSYLSMHSAAENYFLMKYDKNGNNVWSFRVQGITGAAGGIAGHPMPIFAGQDAIYIGGQTDHYASMNALSQSSSLIFFGLNPPFSFIVLAGLISGSVASLILFRRFRRSRVRPPRVGLGQRLRLPTDYGLTSGLSSLICES
jgi:hypothetical protein